MDKLREFVALMIPDLEENTRTLQRKIDLLKVKKIDVDEKLQNAAYHSGKKRKREVEEWSNNVENIITEFETLEQQVQQRSRIYHVFTRQELAEQLERMTKEVTELVEQSDFPSGLFLDVDGNNGQLLLTQANGQAFLQNLDDIYMSLMEDDILSIGIYGMGGVGKTTLAMRAHDKLLTESRFLNQVYWVTVSQEFNTYKLQSDIAQALHLDFSCGSDEKKRAAQLFYEFKKRGRFVLILDDVWKQFDTGNIGIPFKWDGCTLVITSRSEEVCKRMHCNKIIKVNTLFEQEALDLFMKTLDRDDLSLEVKEICKKMARRCGGLPLALITLAGSMRAVNDICEWRDASERLKESRIGPLDMEDEVLPILLYSYNRLRDTRLKNCFLYCCLYPEDFRIPRDELIEKFISEGMMESRLNLQAEINQGHTILNQLERACLLERSFYGSVKMHDLIREMAIRITKDKPRYMVKARLDLKELPEEQKWTDDLDKVSLMYNSIGDISPGTSPKCPRLSTLILEHNSYLHLIPDCFFTQMCGLRTLDLSFTQIRCLPNSISDLEKLNALLLHHCSELASVPSLDKLKLLRHLNLTGTIIEEVPQGMESLTNLKRLCFNCPSLKMIPTGTLHGLSHLQQLILPGHLEVPVEEVEALKQLEVFQGRLGSICDLKRLIKSRRSDERLFSYRIVISNRKSSADLGKARAMEFSFIIRENMLSQNTETLFFSRSGLSGCFLDEFSILNYFRDIKECIIEEEDKMESIMSLPSSTYEDQRSSGVPFQSLEVLKLCDLPNFIGLFKWEAFAPLPPGAFSCLKRLSIIGCGKIKKVFHQSLINNFHDLESLSVWNCVQMEEIIEDYNNEGADITLPRLQELSLVNLPQLKNICKGKMTPSSANEQQQSSGVPFQSLETLELCDLPNLIGLFNWEVVAPLPPGTFSCLKQLSIEGCDKIKKLFPRNLVHNFHDLESLSVENCVQMEEIIEDYNNEGADITLPRLQELSLVNLPQLKNICKGKMTPSSANEQQQSSGVLFQSLERLVLEDMPNFIGLFNWEVVAPLPPGTFYCLKDLSINGCDKIKKLFPRSLVHNFHNLQSLTVENCVQMEEIIEDYNNEGADITLPRLKSLVLNNLPQLKIICKGKMTPSSANEQQPSSGVLFQSLKSLVLEDLPNFIGLFNWEVVAPLPPVTFYCLKVLSIQGCDKIKKLFPRSLVHNLHKLQSLAVQNCVHMEEIIEDYNNEGADITLPRLKSLHLNNLPQLKSICKGKMICDSIEFICLEGIKNIKKFPLHLPLLHGQLSSPPHLRKIYLMTKEKEWWKSLEWGHHNANNVLEHLFHYLC